MTAIEHVTPVTRCKCGLVTTGPEKCPTCRTFATDHAWRGDWYTPGDTDNPRCWDCDLRYGSHR